MMTIVQQPFKEQVQGNSNIAAYASENPFSNKELGSGIITKSFSGIREPLSIQKMI